MQLTSNYAKKSDPVKSAVDAASDIQNIALGIGSYSEIMRPCLDKVEMALSVIKDCDQCIASLEAAGYSDTWLDIVNSDGNFMEFIGITPSDLIGTVAHKKDVCMQGLIDTLQEWALKIWEFIVNALTRLFAFLKKVGFIRKEDIDKARESSSLIMKFADNFEDAILKVPEHKFASEVPRWDHLKQRVDVVSAIAVKLSNGVIQQDILMGRIQVTDAVSQVITGTFLNAKHGCTVDHETGKIQFGEFQLERFELRDWLNLSQSGVDANIAGVMTSITAGQNIISSLETAVDTLLRTAKAEYNAAKKKHDMNQMTISSERATRCQSILNIVNVLITQVSIVSNFCNVYNQRLQEVAQWLSQFK